LQDTVCFTGWVRDKATFFAGIDLFCLPSHHEPFGIVLIEAMAHALPIVATDSEGPSEILRDGVDGVLVPRGNPERLERALGQLIASPEQAADLADNAYRRALELYDLPQVGARIDRALRAIVRRAASNEAPWAMERT